MCQNNWYTPLTAAERGAQGICLMILNTRPFSVSYTATSFSYKLGLLGICISGKWLPTDHFPGAWDCSHCTPEVGRDRCFDLDTSWICARKTLMVFVGVLFPSSLSSIGQSLWLALIAKADNSLRVPGQSPKSCEFRSYDPVRSGIEEGDDSISEEVIFGPMSISPVLFWTPRGWNRTVTWRLDRASLPYTSE